LTLSKQLKNMHPSLCQSVHLPVGCDSDMLFWDRQGNCKRALILSYLDVADDAIENVIAQAIEFLSACYLLLVVWHAPLGARSAKRRHQSPEWTLLSHSNASSGERLLDFRSCWIVFIHVIR